MKSRFVLLSCLSMVCILSACGTADTTPMDDTSAVPDPIRTAETAASQTPGSEESSEITTPPQTASTLHALGDANARGWYKIQYDAAPGWYANEIVFADAAEKRIDVPAGMPDGIPESGRPGDLQVDDTQLVWTWSGLLTDTPVLVVTDLDGSQTGAVHFPQGWYLTGWETMAADDQYLYAKGGAISDDPARLDERRLLRLDPQNDTIETLTTWDAYGGCLFGVWDGKLLITRRVLNPACPVQPVYRYYHIDNFNEMAPFLREILYALDPATGHETMLAEGPVYTFGPQRKLAGDALWWVDGTHLMHQTLGTDEARTLADLPQSLWLYSVFDEDIFLLGQQGEKSTLYVYHPVDGTLEESTRRYAREQEDSYIDIICQAAPGEYLITAGASPVQYALAKREAILENTADVRIVTNERF